MARKLKDPDCYFLRRLIKSSRKRCDLCGEKRGEFYVAQFWKCGGSNGCILCADCMKGHVV